MKLHKNTILDVLSLALPAVGENILYMMIGVFDTMMVGKYGGNVAVSSVGLGSEIIAIFSNIFVGVGLSTGITSLVARRTGAKDIDKAEEFASIGILCTVIISLTLNLIFFNFASPILRFAGSSESVISMGSTYIKIVSIGAFFNMITNSLNATLRGFGNTKTPLLIATSINITNIFLDVSLIFGKFGFPELGIKGAAIATATAQILGFISICLYMYFKSSIKIRLHYIKNLKASSLKSLLKLSIPSSLQEASLSISRLLCNFMIMSLGTIAFASNQIATSIESLSFMPGWGFSIAATSLVGHKIGERNYKEAKEYALSSILLGCSFMFLCSFLFLFLPQTLISLFITGEEVDVIALGTKCLMVASVEQPVMGLSMIVSGSLKGLGDTKTPFLISCVSSWVVRLPLMYYFIYYLKSSVVTVWWITAIQWGIDGLAVTYLFIKNMNTKFSHEAHEK